MTINELLDIMAKLRDPDHGCPWDRKQTFDTIVPHTLEEVYEVVDTIERKDYDHLANELGDLLFQVVFYAQLGKEAGLFDFDEVVSEICNKLLTRHPHVFPDASLASFGSPADITAEQVEGNWEAIKQQERDNKGQEPGSILDDIPRALPALTRARKIQKRAARSGFDWPVIDGVLDKVNEENAELREAMASGEAEHIEEELGDMFFSLVNLSRHLNIEPEKCLRKANEKFESRFRRMEKVINSEDRDLATMDLEEMENYWQQIKNSN